MTVTLPQAYKEVEKQIKYINETISSINTKTVLKTSLLFFTIFSLGFVAVMALGTTLTGFLAYHATLFTAGYIGMNKITKRIYENNLSNFHLVSYLSEKILLDTNFSSKIQSSFDFKHEVQRTLQFPHLIDPIEMPSLEEVQEKHDSQGWFS